MELAGFKMIRQIIWQKTNPVPLNMRSTYLSNSREMAVMQVSKWVHLLSIASMTPVSMNIRSLDTRVKDNTQHKNH